MSNVREEDPVWNVKKEFIKRLLKRAEVSPAVQGMYFIFAYNVYRGKRRRTLTKEESIREQIEKWAREGLRKDLLEQIAKIVSAR